MSYAPASPDLSSFYSGSATTHRSTNPSSDLGDIATSSAVNSHPSPPSGLAFPVSPTPTTRQTQYHYQNQNQGQFSSHPPTEQHPYLYTPQQNCYYSPKSPVSPQPRTAQTHSLSHHNHQPQYRPGGPQTLQHTVPQTLGAGAQGPSQPQHQFYPQYGGNHQHHQHGSQPQDQPYSPASQAYLSHSELASGRAPVVQVDSYPIKSESRYHLLNSETMPPRRSAAAAVAAAPSAATIEPSPVKTKFPTARIKRIMQADEEVGKVAQQTPIAVGKALELFMVALVSKSHSVARDKGAKRVTAQHLKQVIESDEQWDFLLEIAGRVSETEEKTPKAGGGSRSKAESDSDDDAATAAVPKKRGRGGRKKKEA